ncbi:uncharacterized protein [Drosophila tropicalis]|uniref:uncharacterized protein n=1 Tax=Drosophila tropicalis TaxID=46794 RepID=UPI0035AC08C6
MSNMGDDEGHSNPNSKSNDDEDDEEDDDDVVRPPSDYKVQRVARNAVIFKMTNAVCLSYNESWVIIHTCRLKAVQRDRTTFNFNGTILKEARDIELHMRVFKRASGYKPWLFHVEMDACRYLRKPYNPFGILVFNLYKEFTNFNHSCPYIGTQIVKGFYLRPELLKLPLPSGDYLLSIRWHFDKKLQFDTNVSFQFVEDIAVSRR